MQITKKQIIYTGVLFHLLTAFFSVGYHQCDELFQVFEFAGYKLGINQAGDLPWEFASRMRSGVEPLWVYSFTRLFHALSVTNPFHVALFLRLLQAGLSFFAVCKLTRVFEKDLDSEKAKTWLWALALLLWCLPYFHARLSSENFGSTLFLYGLALVLERLNKRAGFIALFAAGFLFGLSFVCRFQLLFMIAGLAAWLLFVKRVQASYYVKLLPGFAAALGCNLLADCWLYNEWTLSWWNYLYQNFFESKASVYGESPFYFYIGESLLQLIPPFSLLIVGALIGFWIRFRAHVLTWITLPFILLHFFVAHKELRFLFPVLNFLPVMLVFYFHSLQSTNAVLRITKHKVFIYFAVIVNGLLLCYFSFKPADETSGALKKIYDHAEGSDPVLYYEGTNPYNTNAGLNYFKNRELYTIHLDTTTAVSGPPGNDYYFVEKCNGPDTVSIAGVEFIKVYSSFPGWFRHLNFNGWLDRAYSYSIYKKI